MRISIIVECRKELEERQLHQIIGQLRQARKAVKEEEEDIVAERDQLREKLISVTHELQIMKEQYEASAVIAAKASKLESKLAESDSRCEDLESQLEVISRDLRSAEKKLYDASIVADNAKADALIAQRELKQKTSELQNIQVALAAFERDSALSQRKLNEVWQQRIDDLRAEHAKELEKEREDIDAKLKGQSALVEAAVNYVWNSKQT